jgi:hypothetical protein
MNLYYIAADLADGSAGKGNRLRAFGMALASILLNPGYETRNKAGLIARIGMGKAAFQKLRRLVRHE